MESLYEVVCRIEGNSGSGSLQILKIESGASLSINLKGVGEPIKQLKELILEVWTKHRQKRVDEILDHHKVMASGIRLIDEIDKTVKRKSLSHEDGERFKRSVLKDTLPLFGNGALIEEIPAIGKVNNLALLGSFGPGLLSAPKDGDEATAEEAYKPSAPMPEMLDRGSYELESPPAASRKKSGAKKRNT